MSGVSRRERLTYWLEEASYHLQIRFHLTLALTGWLCRRGVHRFEYDPESGRSWSEPGEPGWDCVYCLRSGYPYRYAVQDWFWGHAPLRWYAEWRTDRDWQRYLQSEAIDPTAEATR